MADTSVREVVAEVIGKDGDETIREYITSILEFEDFDYGRGGENAYDSFGELLVDAKCLPDDAAAQDACRQLAVRLGGEEYVEKQSFRSLEGGPVMMESMNKVSLHASEVLSARDTIQTPYAEFNVGADLPKVSEADLAKLQKRAEKEEKAARSALAAHQAEAAAAAAGAAPTIVRNAGSLGARDLHLENFSVSNGGKELIEDATVTLAFGRRYGLVGRNGTGKTTLLRHMAAHLIKGIPKNCQILHVEQEVTGGGTSVLETVLRCDTERTELLAEEARLTAELNTSEASTNGNYQEPTAFITADGGAKAPQKKKSGAAAGPTVVNGAAGKREVNPQAAAQLEKVWKRLQEIDADQAESRAASILAGLSFTPEMQAKPTSQLSGGWRMRVALARALFVEPDLLLLDEPTNHLDLHAVLWLEEYLLKWPKTLLVVSHAREFLNAVCTDVVHLHSCKLTSYRGNYDVFEKTAAERLRNAKKAAEGHERQRKHMQSFVDKFRYNAKRAALVQSRIKAIERLGEVELIEDDPEYIFRFPAPDLVAPPILSFQNVSFAYPGGPMLFKGLDFGLDMESRLAIVGANGIGKSTLLNLISGGLEPTEGAIVRNPKVRMATFSQHHVDGLDLALNPLQSMLRTFPNTKEQEMRQHLGSFGIGGELALQPMYTLSGGQKSRVAFAKVTYQQPHILLLDEPSNHLDLDAVQALIQGLLVFKGGVLMVSHDQFLIESVVNELWVVDNGAAVPFHGTFQQYKTRLRAQSNQGKR